MRCGSGSRGGCGWTDGARGEGPLAQDLSRSRSPASAPAAGLWSAPGGWARCLRTASGSVGLRWCTANEGALLLRHVWSWRGARRARGGHSTDEHETRWADVRREPVGRREFPLFGVRRCARAPTGVCQGLRALTQRTPRSGRFTAMRVQTREAHWRRGLAQPPIMDRA